MRMHCIRLDWRHDVGEGFIKELGGLLSLDSVAQIDALNDWIHELEEMRNKKIAEAYHDSKERQA